MRKINKPAFGKWADAHIPRTGWTCVGSEDLGEPSEICAMCEGQEIRYVHCMQHPEYPDELRCGCMCAGRMEDDCAAAKRRDKALKDTAKRESRGLKRQWKRSAKGNAYINFGGYNVVVFPVASVGEGGGWAYRVTNRTTNDYMPSPPCRSPDVAKLRAFDALSYMKEAGR